MIFLEAYLSFIENVAAAMLVAHYDFVAGFREREKT